MPRGTGTRWCARRSSSTATPYLAGAGPRARRSGPSTRACRAPRSCGCAPRSAVRSGALGDRLFWTGLVPAGGRRRSPVSSLEARGWSAIVALVVVYNVIRLAPGPGSSRPDSDRDPGRRRDHGVVAARAAERVGPAAGFWSGSRFRWWRGASRPAPAATYRCRARWSLADRRRGARNSFGPRCRRCASRWWPSLLTPLYAGGGRDRARGPVHRQLARTARPARGADRAAGQRASPRSIELEKDDLSVNAKSIMGVMMLAAESGSVIRAEADGADAEAAVEALAALVASGFGETTASRSCTASGCPPAWPSGRRWSSSATSRRCRIAPSGRRDVEGEIAGCARRWKPWSATSIAFASACCSGPGTEESQIFDAQILMVRDPDFLAACEHLIRHNQLARRNRLRIQGARGPGRWGSTANVRAPRAARRPDRDADPDAPRPDRPPR